MLIREELLHFIWRFRRFEQRDLQTADGGALVVIFPGQYNRHAGPDFSGAKISIGGTLWAGNVEIHIRSSDWKRHQHTTDKAYDSVILHVVFEHDAEVERTDGTQIPVLVLRHKIEETLIARYHQLADAQQQFIPCENLFGLIDDLIIGNWLERMLFERMEQKAGEIIAAVKDNHGDWDEIFYQFLAKNFGFKVNAFPMEMLARSLPQKIIARHKQNAAQVEALLFGQAGLLDGKFSDEYPGKLQHEYKFLAAKYSLKAVDKHLWMFFRLRPLNFPTIRLAQFSALAVASNHLFSKAIAAKSISEYEQLFSSVSIHEYWKNHYRFDKPSPSVQKTIGKEAIGNIFINTFAPFLFAYGKHISDERLIGRSIGLLENIRPEKNNIVSGFVNLGFRAVSAQDSQALIELKNNYCDNKRCLDCVIGCSLLKPV